MKFDCKVLSITDEEFGCSVTFSEKNNGGLDQKNMTLNELKNYTGSYVMLQRTYAKSASEKGQIEEDYLYIETDDPNKSGELTNFIIHVYPSKLSITYNQDLIEINFNENALNHQSLRQIIPKIIGDKGQINFWD
ncbi:MAG: hypothetical protein Q8M15_11500 [Bacteroidota bacterium]|nr:hypothetical protein [Bacteroidota bacterium]